MNYRKAKEREVRCEECRHSASPDGDGEPYVFIGPLRIQVAAVYAWDRK